MHPPILGNSSSTAGCCQPVPYQLFVDQSWGSSNGRGYCHQKTAVLPFLSSFSLGNEQSAVVEDTQLGTFKISWDQHLDWWSYALIPFHLVVLSPGWSPYNPYRSGQISEAGTLAGLDIFLPWEIQPLYPWSVCRDFMANSSQLNEQLKDEHNFSLFPPVHLQIARTCQPVLVGVHRVWRQVRQFSKESSVEGKCIPTELPHMLFPDRIW